MPERGIAILAISFAFGILAAQYCSLAFLLLCIAAIAFYCMVFAKSVSKSTAVIIGIFIILGFARYNIGREIPKTDISNYSRYTTAFEGNVASDPDAREDQTRLVFKVNRIRTHNSWQKAAGYVMVAVYDNDKDDTNLHLSYGEHAIISAVPYFPMPPTNPGQFYWGDYLARKGIYTCASVKRSSQIHILSRNNANNFIFYGLAIKHYIVDCISRLHPKREASVISGMVLGTYAYLPSEVMDNFTKTGTLHMLAASGYNCWILLFLAVPLLKKIKIATRWRNIVVIFLIGMYLIIVGCMPSLLRAAIMSSLLLLAQPLRRVANTKNLLFTAGLIILAINPADLFDIGFQLSFLAVCSLIFIKPIISVFLKNGMQINTVRKQKCNDKKTDCIMNWIINEAAAAGIATTAVSLITAPIIAYYFNYVSLVSLPANMLLALGEPVVFADGFISTIGAHIGILGYGIGAIGTFVTRAMLGTINLLGSMNYAALSISSPSILEIAGYYLIIYAVLSYVDDRFAQK